MNRRDFLKGFAGTAGVVVAGAIPIGLLEPVVDGPQVFSDAWFSAIADVYSDHHYNVLTYGVGGLQHIDEFPYIKSIPPQDIYVDLSTPTTFKGLL